jgi:hypothetical protein
LFVDFRQNRKRKTVKGYSLIPSVWYQSLHKIDFCRARKRETECQNSVKIVCRCATVKWYSQKDCRRCWKYSQLQSDNKISKRAGRRQNMATKVHGHGGKKNHQQQRKEKMDKELAEIRVRMEELALRVQQNARTRWVYEWPLRRKAKWLVKKLLARGQRRLLRRWLRYMKSLRATEEMVHACEPEAGRNLSDDEEERSLEDLMNCQGGSEESSICKEGNEMGSLDDLRDC